MEKVSEDFKLAFKDFVRENPELAETWFEEALRKHKNLKVREKRRFEKFDIETIRKRHSIKRETIEELQKLWADAPPAEELVKLLSP